MFSTNLSSSSNTNLNMNSFGQDYSSHHSNSTAMASSIGTHHHFTSHYSGHQPSSSMFSPSSFHQPYFPSTLDQNQFTSLNRQPPATHGLNSTTPFPTNPFHLNLNSKSNFDQHHSSLMPNESYNSSGFNSSASSSSSSSPNSSSSSPDTKFNFLHTPQSTYLNYLNSNTAFSNQSSTFNSIGHQLQSNSNLHHNSFPSFNQTNKAFGDVLNNQLNNPLNNPINNQFNNNLMTYDEDDLHDEDEDDISISHYDMKTIMNYNNSDPLPGKTRTREKYRSVYTEIQRHELENEFVHSKYVSIKRKSELAQKLALSERQIKIWFQNRRAKERRTGQKKPDNQEINIKYDLHPHAEVNYKYELQI